MSSCSGPYTRTFLDRGDGTMCGRLAGGLAALGIEATCPRVPDGSASLDDLSFDLDGIDAASGARWSIRVSKYLGPKKMLLRTHVYEAALSRTDAGHDEPWRGHLFDTALGSLVERLLAVWPELAAGRAVGGVVPRSEAHEVRIDMCLE